MVPWMVGIARTSTERVMKLLLLLAGVVLGVVTLTVVKQVSVFGNTCFYVGQLNANTQCLSPGFYYGALGLAGVLVVLGIVGLATARGSKA